MTGETTTATVNEMEGTVHRRSRAASLAAPLVCDLYRRSFSESPDYPSPRVRRPPTRSHSVKVRKTLPTPDFDPNSRWYCYRVRSFTLSSRAVINRGDSVRYRQTRGTLPGEAPCAFTPLLQTNPEPDIERFRVQLLGATGVGKTALANQFLTSEHVFVRSALPEISLGERDVTVLLNRHESQLTFVDAARTYPSEEGENIEPDAFLVIYSIASRESFEFAQKLLQDLRPKMPNKTIFLVGNKSDLVRGRTVSPQEGRVLASTHCTKFIETSVGINYHVDELLVGTLAQLRLRQNGRNKSAWPSLQKASFRVRKLLHRIMGKEEPPAPCDMLHSL